MSKTKLKKLHVEKFRALNGVDIEFGDHITVVCGKNGTSKSSILGIAAQIFSFEKDYANDVDLAFEPIVGGEFKSKYSEHFRISDKYDIPGSMKVNIHLTDGYTAQDATARLELMKRGAGSRPVVRNNSTVGDGNTSRNFTHPVIFLSLKRLFPIADRKYTVKDHDYLMRHKSDFIGLTNALLNRTSSQATGTAGTISSAVAHGENYDQDSVSAGEDNAGQIILALMSFKKLKEEYPDYKGGLLLIDEADAGLFPTAQVNLFKILASECRDLKLQVVMTSHSPTLIEHAYEQSTRFPRLYKTVYLSNTLGPVQVRHDLSWMQISADIHTKTYPAPNSTKLPKVNVYFEDQEAADMFNALLTRQQIKNYLNPLPEITLGCSNYIQLANKGIKDFSEKGIVVLDADAAKLLKHKHPRSIVLLPGSIPPDQLIFEHLYNLPADDPYWKNATGFTREVFTNSAREVIRLLDITGNTVDVAERIATFQSGSNDGTKLREVFKRFYKDDDVQKAVKQTSKPINPWKHWVDHHAQAKNTFLVQFQAALEHAMKKGFTVPSAMLTTLHVKLK